MEGNNITIGIIALAVILVALIAGIVGTAAILLG